MTRPINIAEYEAAAREVMSKMAYDYYAGGALDEVTLRRNESAFDEIRLRYRVLRDVSSRDLATTVLGEEIEMPIVAEKTSLKR